MKTGTMKSEFDAHLGGCTSCAKVILTVFFLDVHYSGTHSPGDAADMQRFVMAIYSALLFAVVLVL